MSIKQLADRDFERAISKGFWRRIIARMLGRTNGLLPFDEVRQRLPIKGQRSLGIQEVRIENIIGSFGRYQDFDRAFLPLSRSSRERWIAINIAHYRQRPLPPVELYKIGEIYFVKDGHHRVSVAREMGGEFIDAYVTEIDVAVPLDREVKISDLDLKEAYASFLQASALKSTRPQAEIECSQPAYYDGIVHHISLHQWYLAEKKGAPVSFQAAAESWYDHVYTPLVAVIQERDILKEFPGSTLADLAVWLMDLSGYLQLVDPHEDQKGDLMGMLHPSQGLLRDYPVPAVRKLVRILNQTDWIESLLLEQEKAVFYHETGILALREGVDICTSIPGQYRRIMEHISVHRWYLGEREGECVPYEMAVVSWYDNVYAPLVEIIREQDILAAFPNRTASDLYLWIIEHQWYLRQAYGGDVTIQDAADHFVEDFTGESEQKHTQGEHDEPSEGVG